MPATPEAIKSTADAAGHAGENRNAFIGFDGLDMDSIHDFPAIITLSDLHFWLRPGLKVSS